MAAETFEWISDRLGGGTRSESLKAAAATLPDGVYTTFRTYGGRRVLRLDQHAARLSESARLKGTPAVVAPRTVRQAVAAALDRTRHAESRVRLTFAQGRLFASVEPFTPLAPAVYETGAACVTVRIRRENPHAKDTRFAATAQAAYASLPAGVEEALMLDEAGAVLEGLSSNFFAVRDGRLWTEDERVLQGVTRSIVLEVAAAIVPVTHAAPTLAGIREAFVTSVSREVLPVVRIDGQPVGDGRPGETTRAIARAFAALVEHEAEEL